jgi:hypothetical protein
VSQPSVARHKLFPKVSYGDLTLQRHKLETILTAANWPYQVIHVFHRGATLLSDGTAPGADGDSQYGALNTSITFAAVSPNGTLKSLPKRR